MDENAVYSLYLNTRSDFPLLYNNSNKAQVTWLVNWDNFFDSLAHQYNKCRVRAQLITNPSSSIVVPDNMGVLTANFGSRYTGGITRDVPLGLVQVAPTPTAGSNIIFCDTLQTAGANINIPSGSTYFTLSLYKTGFGAGNIADSALQSNVTEYQVLLTFELYDRRE